MSIEETINSKVWIIHKNNAWNEIPCAQKHNGPQDGVEERIIKKWVFVFNLYCWLKTNLNNRRKEQPQEGGITHCDGKKKLEFNWTLSVLVYPEEFLEKTSRYRARGGLPHSQWNGTVKIGAKPAKQLLYTLNLKRSKKKQTKWQKDGGKAQGKHQQTT